MDFPEPQVVKEQPVKAEKDKTKEKKENVNYRINVKAYKIQYQKPGWGENSNNGHHYFISPLSGEHQYDEKDIQKEFLATKKIIGDEFENFKTNNEIEVKRVYLIYLIYGMR
jgi:hypothetical protein